MSKTRIATQPASASVRGTSTATFKVKATGKSLKYQWYTRASTAKTYKAIKGATKSSYKTPKLANTSKKQYYRVVVTGKNGKVTSKTATLKVTAWQKPSLNYGPKNIQWHDRDAKTTTLVGKNLAGTTGTYTCANSFVTNRAVSATASGSLSFKTPDSADFWAYNKDLNECRITIKNPAGSASLKFWLAQRTSAQVKAWIPGELADAKRKLNGYGSSLAPQAKRLITFIETDGYWEASTTAARVALSYFTGNCSNEGLSQWWWNQSQREEAYERVCLSSFRPAMAEFERLQKLSAHP